MREQAAQACRACRSRCISIRMVKRALSMLRRGMVLVLLCALLGYVLMAFPSSAGAKSVAYPDLEAFVDEVMKAQMEKYDMTNAAVAVVSGERFGWRRAMDMPIGRSGFRWMPSAPCSASDRLRNY